MVEEGGEEAEKRWTNLKLPPHWSNKEEAFARVLSVLRKGKRNFARVASCPSTTSRDEGKLKKHVATESSV